jgi:hypothetical protein
MIVNSSRWKIPARRFPITGIVLRVIAILMVAMFARGAEQKHVRLLAIGNSFSGNATHYLPNIVEAAGDKLTFGTISIGGCPLQKHWTNALAFQNGSADSNAVAWKKLTAEKWDFVTIQQYSMFSYKIETYRPFAKQLHDYIKSQVPSAEVLVHETWAYRADDSLFNKDGFKQQDMYWQLRNAYETIARELGSRIIPVGDAFENARCDKGWGGVFPDPKFDSKKAVYPDLPDQTHSLNKGWSWATAKDGKHEIKFDGHHASTAGEYLGAAVWYEFLFGHSVVGNSFAPNELGAGDAALLQRIAHETVTGGSKPAKANP